MAKDTREALNFDLSYNLSRKYPFQRLKWIVFALLTTLCAVFTIFYVATVGYDMHPSTSMDPNATEAERHWYNNKLFTWGDDALTPTCQDEEIGIGALFLTSNKGASYTVKSISDQCAPFDCNTKYPSLSYHNQHLENCRVNGVTVYLRKADDSRPGVRGSWISWGISNAAAEAQCDVVTPNGTYSITLGSTYNGLSKVFDLLALMSFDERPSLWWGAQLMDNYFNGLLNVMATGLDPSNQSQQLYSNAQLMFSTADNASMEGFSLFNSSFFYYEAQGGILNQLDLDVPPSTDIWFNNGSWVQSRSMTEGYLFAKAYYSVVLADLGQSQLPNLVLDDKLLQYALDPPDDFNRASGGPLHLTSNRTTWGDWWRSSGIIRPYVALRATVENSVPMAQAYTDLPKKQLKIDQAQLYMQYTCSVPKARPVLSTFITVLVSLFVVVQTAWIVVKFFADRYLAATDEKAMYCDGCIALLNGSKAEIAMVRLQNNASPVSDDGSSTHEHRQSVHNYEPV